MPSWSRARRSSRNALNRSGPPADQPLPLSSNLNFVPGQTVANRVIVKLGSGGAVSFYNLYGHADVVADMEVAEAVSA